jgi:toxin HigB-1
MYAMIRSFRDKATEAIFNGSFAKGINPRIQQRAREKLKLLDAAVSLEDLRSPPGNRLEALTKDRAAQHSIRINDQWRVCFRWNGQDALNVEVVDCH